MQCACAVLSRVAYQAINYFSFSHIRHIFSIKNLLKEKCVLIFSAILSENFSFQEEVSKILSKICTGLHVKYPLVSSYFKET